MEALNLGMQGNQIIAEQKSSFIEFQLIYIEEF